MIFIILLILAFYAGLKIEKNFAPQLFIDGHNLKIHITKGGTTSTHTIF